VERRAGSLEGCYDRATGSIRLVDSASRCRGAESAILWGAVGAKVLRGARGPAGPAGAAGAAGAHGAVGPAGARGPAGAAGAAGGAGPRGAQGPAGAPGKAGPPGPRGAQGLPGVIGSFDRVRNLPCTRSGVAGVISVGYAADGTATIRCNLPGRSVASQCASLPHARSSCDAGTLAVAACDDGFADADGVASNGCEVDLTNDPANCGAVGRSVGQAPHAVLTCAGGQPKVLCADGFSDVDEQPGNGCEVDLTRDRRNCGSVGRAVPAVGKLWHVVSVDCVEGVPTVTRCDPGWRDDDGSYPTGCEGSATPAAGRRPGGPAIVVTVSDPEAPG
jgi:hypothetical protein